MARKSLKNINLLKARDEENLKFVTNSLLANNLRPLMKKSRLKQLETIKKRIDHYNNQYENLYANDVVTIVTYKNKIDELVDIYYPGITDSIELGLVIDRDSKKYGIYYHDTQQVITGVPGESRKNLNPNN